MEQLNLMGDYIPFSEIPGNAPPPPKTGRRFKTMQELHGETPGHVCKECTHLVKLQFSKAYYKCAIWRLSHSTATDIRIKKTACGKFEARQGAIRVVQGG